MAAGANVPGGLAGRSRQFLDRLDRDLHLLVAEHHGAEHHVLGQAVRLGLDHQHRVGRAGDDEVELRGLQYGVGRVQHVLAVDVADSRTADRAPERHAGNRERGRGAEHRRDVRIDLGVERHDGRDDLHFVVEAFREQRADRTVDQPRRQCFLLGGATFALEEAAGDAAGRVRLLDVVDGQREEVLARLRLLASDRRDENDGVAHRNDDGTVGLARHAAGFEGDGMGAELKTLRMDVHVWSTRCVVGGC